MTTQTYSIQEAKGDLQRLLRQVASGNDVIIAEKGRPVARLSRIDESKPKIIFGVLKGKVKVAEDFDAPLPADVLSQFEGN